MSRLFLLRHAKAAWAKPGEHDFDRPLTAAGIADSRSIGAQMKALGLVPERVLCSTALRARETWQGVSTGLGIAEDSASYLDDLYSTDAAGHLEIAQRAPASESVMLVGHNPMMEDLAEALAGSGDEAARAVLAAGFPKSGLAVIRFDGPLSSALPRKGHLEHFLIRIRAPQD